MVRVEGRGWGLGGWGRGGDVGWGGVWRREEGREMGWSGVCVGGGGGEGRIVARGDERGSEGDEREEEEEEGRSRR